MDMFIDGKWQPAISGKTNPVNDPSTRSAFDTVPDAGSEVAESAIHAAQTAFEGWRRVPRAEPVRVVKACAQAMRNNAQQIGETPHLEIGREKGRSGGKAFLDYKTIYLSYEVPL